MENIAIIYGSDSSEWEVSIKSGEFTASCLDSSRFNIYEIFARFGSWKCLAYKLKGGHRHMVPTEEQCEVDKTDFSIEIDGKKVKLEFAYIMQHGTPGENGLMQGYLEMLGIPHSSCSSFVAAVTFDKYSCKNYLRDVPYVKCAKDIFLRRGQKADAQQWVDELGLPMFIKPTDGGSSFGVTKVKKPEDIQPAIEAAFEEGVALIAEQAISGRELTCAVFKDGDECVAMPVIEIVPHNEWFDYEAKYNGLSDELCPAPLDKAQWDMVQDAAKKIYIQLGCEGLVRCDFILAEDGLYFLELNIVPGMTSASLVPQMAREAGLDITAMLNKIIESKCC